LHERWCRFEKGLRVGEILQPFRAAPGWISSGTELLMQQINTTDDPQVDIL
jgi:hypothetical protein